MSFEILKKVSYLDNASTTQKPKSVVLAMSDFYLKEYANTHRGIYDLSERATDIYESGRETVAKFINAKKEEVVFTSSATVGFNNLARCFKGKKILLTQIEHHSNFLPWREHCKISVVPYNKDIGCLDWIPFHYKGEDVVSFTLMSNVSGEILSAKKIIQELRKKNKDVIVIIDASQAISHMKIDVKDLDCDFLVFSAHKVYGPTGLGVLYGKQTLLENLNPFNFGGGMVLDFSDKESVWLKSPHKHEAGTMNGTGVVGLVKAIDFLLDNFEKKMEIEKELLEYLLLELKKVDAKIIGHTHENFGPVVSFIISGVHPHDLASVCNERKVCIRSGHHCAKPFMKALGVIAVSRASLSFYNTKKDIDKLIQSIKKARQIFNG